MAQTPIPASTQFDITGFLEEATVTSVGDPLSGGTLRVNGHTITVPSSTIVILPANALTWTELFTHAPAPYNALNETGLALADLPAPLVGAEVHVVGNRVLPDANHATDQYIAGLVFISQQSLNSGAGFINFVDYALGELRVGGILNDPNCAQGVVNPLCSGARVRINDPVGRFGRNTTSPDARFCVDDANPTIIAGTGFPMCLPRTDPAVVDDPLCPQANRPRDVLGNFIPSIDMLDPAAIDAAGALVKFPDPRIQAPLEVGDYITFSGTLVVDAVPAGFGPTEGPFPLPTAGGTGNTYVSAHTITNNVAIFTAPGTNPAYVMADTMLIGTGGLTVLGAGEASIRTRFEGMTTDPSRNIHLYGVDYNPADGSTADRDFGTIGVDQGPPLGAVKGRWRFRPPCLPFGSVPAKPDKQCVYNATGTFLPPPRELRAVIEGMQTQVPITAASLTAANGIVYGQYHAPIFEYIFPENIPGTPIVENNFNTIDFLTKGGYSSSTGALAGVLNPWPSNVLPSTACSAAVASAGGPYSVASGGTVVLAGTASGTTPVTLAWTADSGTFSDPTIGNAVFTAPAVAAQTIVNLTLTATNACGTNTSTTTVTVNGPTAPAVVIGPASSVTAGTPVTLTATLAGASSFTFTQTGGAPILLNPNPTTVLTATGTAAVTLNTSVVLSASTTLTFSVTGSVGGVASPAATVALTLNPVADQITITLAEYRIGKQRLIVNATSSVVSPTVVLTLQPYVTATGTLFDPATLGNTFTNTGGGLYTLTLVGAPEPAVPPAAPIVVKSSLGGTSPASPLTRIRQ